MVNKNLFLAKGFKRVIFLLIPFAFVISYFSSSYYHEQLALKEIAGLQEEVIKAMSTVKKNDLTTSKQSLAKLYSHSQDIHYLLVGPKAEVLFDSKHGHYELVENQRREWQKILDGKSLLHTETIKDKLSVTVKLTDDHALKLSKKSTVSQNKIFIVIFIVAIVVLSCPLIIFFVLGEKSLQVMLVNSRRQLGLILHAKKIGDESYSESNGEQSLYKQLNKVQRKIYQKERLFKKEIKQWESMNNSMPRGILAVQKDTKILYCNDQTFQHFGITPRKYKEQMLIRVIRDVDLERFVKKAFKEKIYEKEIQIISHGCMKTMKLSAAPVQLEEEKALMLIVEDTTRLNQLEKMRQEFINNVSHELKTPITVIMGFVEVLKSSIESQPEKSLQFLDKISRNANRMDLIIRDLLTLSKIELDEEYHQQGLTAQSINSTILNTVDLCSTEISRHKVEIDLDINDFLGHELIANHSLIEQALRNLIENAVRYSGVDSRVTIKSSRVGDFVNIEVRDNGVGIPVKYHEKVFQRFFRVDKSRDRKTGGSGLGLAIVKHIMRIHDGYVDLESEEGKGCCFTLVLPIKAK